MPASRSAVRALALAAVSVACGDAAAPDKRPAPAVVGCRPGELTLPDGRCQPAGLPPDMACSAGELALPDGRCQPAGLPLDMPCPPGALALPDGRCQPAGVPEASCAAGFVTDGRGGCDVVLPSTACAPGTMAVPGERACRDIAPCGDGRWGDIPDEATAQYVDQSYGGLDSDGSRDRPWTTMQAGIDAAAPGAIVAVTDGRYEEDVVIAGRPVRLWGRCPARVQVVGQGGEDAAVRVQQATAAGSEVRGLAVTGPRMGIRVANVRSVVLEDIHVHDAGSYGIEILGGEAVLRNALVEENQGIGVFLSHAEATIDAAVVRATQPVGAGTAGRGIAIEAVRGTRSALALRGSLVDQNREVGVYIYGSDATIEASAIRETQVNSAGVGGQGVAVLGNGTADGRGKLEIRSSLIDRNREAGVVVASSDATVEATVVRATRPAAAQDSGAGAVVVALPNTRERGTLAVRSSLFERNAFRGIAVNGSDATIASTVVRATQPTVKGGGHGINVKCDESTREHGTLDLRASLVEQNREMGVIVDGSDAIIDASVVRETERGGADSMARGVLVTTNAVTGERGSLTMGASLMEANRECGVAIQGADASITATVVRDAESSDPPQPDDGSTGLGIAIGIDPPSGHRGNLKLLASLLERNQAIGLAVKGSDAIVESSVVRETRVGQGRAYGRGIEVAWDPSGASAQLELRRSLVEKNNQIGVSMIGATGLIESSVIRETQPDPGGQIGRGVNIQDNPVTGAPGKLEMSSSLVERNFEDGVVLAGTDASIVNCVVRGPTPGGTGQGATGVTAQLDTTTGTRSALDLRASVLEDNSRFGVLVTSSSAAIDATVVRGTASAPPVLQAGDGILVIDPLGASEVSINNTESTGNARAGVMYVGSTGALSLTMSTRNRFGLVVQPGKSGAEPSLKEGNVFEDNTEKDRYGGRELIVPDTPAPLP